MLFECSDQRLGSRECIDLQSQRERENKGELEKRGGVVTRYCYGLQSRLVDPADTWRPHRQSSLAQTSTSSLSSTTPSRSSSCIYHGLILYFLIPAITLDGDYPSYTATFFTHLACWPSCLTSSFIHNCQFSHGLIAPQRFFAEKGPGNNDTAELMLYRFIIYIDRRTRGGERDAKYGRYTAKLLRSSH